MTAGSADSPSLPLDAAGARPTFFAEGGVDQLLSMVLELAAELWVVRERVYRLEAASETTAIPLKTLADALELTAAQTAELASMRETFLRGLYRTLNRHSVA